LEQGCLGGRFKVINLSGTIIMAILKAFMLVFASFMLTPFLAIPYELPTTHSASANFHANTVKLFKGSVIYKSETGFPDFMITADAENQTIAAL
jgi:hypothetical protein